MHFDAETRNALSSALGYASIVAWLFAQMPQVIENYRLGSVEGLALPFLISWLAGDFTNLVGCILTDQLPFQTYLAVYFVLVDMTLTGQYFYYSKVNPPAPFPPLGIQHMHVHHHLRSDSQHPSQHRQSKHRASRGKRGRSSSQDNLMAASWMSEQSTRESNAARSRAHSDAVPENVALPANHAPERGRTMQRAFSGQQPIALRQPLFGPGGLETISGSPASGGVAPAFVFVQHARQVPPVSNGGEPEPPSPLDPYHPSNSASRSRPPTSRRSTASLVLLSFGLLLSFARVSTPSSASSWSVAAPLDPSAGLVPLSDDRRWLLKRSFDVVTAGGHYDWKRFIGRANAWVCTALYLTSRLPQIWTNFRRQSVEGLAMMLFVMAFIGNLLYVLSILINPLVTEPGYLQESTPYLLGSGGTLCFDCTVVFQSFLYSAKRKERKARRHLLAKGDLEEATGFLQDDELAQGSAGPRSTSRPASVSSRRKMRAQQSLTRLRTGSASVAAVPMSRRESGSRSAARRYQHRVYSANSSTDHSLASSPTDAYSTTDEPSQSRTRTRTASVDLDDIPPIPEAGESSVTVR